LRYRKVDIAVRVMATPRSIEIAITHRCNLHCTYCSHFTSPGDTGQDLPTADWLRFFEELGRLGVMNATFMGGEPFLRKDLPELIEGIVQNRMRFGILTNGTLITDEIAAFLASTGRCDSVQVSIDGSQSEAHDACRGEGSFHKALRGFENLRRHGISVAVRMTIHRHNVHDLEETARFLLEERGLPGFSTNAASYLGLCRENNDLIGLSVEERSLAMEALLRLSARYPGRITAQAGPLAEAKAWIGMEQARTRRDPPIPGKGFLTGCGGAFSKIGVLADGTLVPCIQMSHVRLGRISGDVLKAVWQSHPELERIRRRREIPLSEFASCRGCDYMGYCTGNCPALAYTLTGEDDCPSPDACLRRFIEQGGIIPVASC
jgi:SynChlorMet cassette radical SAM/SPASM protein ScmE